LTFNDHGQADSNLQYFFERTVMKCPKCENSDLRKKSFPEPYDCPECGGIWVREEDFYRMNENSFEAAEDNVSGVKIRDLRTGLCPEGHGIMLRARIEGDNPFYLERCTACGGIWFDGGEWQQIAASHFLKNLPDFWSISWQRNQMQEKNRRQYLQQNEELLGHELFNLILALAENLKRHPDKSRALAFLQQEMKG
jgi:Zn-finger nucleic acid-binding protein